jgi:hypothetical protein
MSPWHNFSMSKKAVQSHIIHDDYFGTLATILDLLRQELETMPEGKRARKVLKGLTADLIYLQDHYEIASRK